MKTNWSWLRIKVLIVVCILAVGGGSAVGQVFYDPFSGTGEIGGSSETTGTTSNGWTTHSNTKAGIIPIEAGSLEYTGLQAPLGNKVLLPGDNTNVPRDVNASVTFPAGTSVFYYSALLYVLDRTQLSGTSFDYFMHLGSNTTTHLARLGIKGVNSRNNFRLAIQNAPGGSPDFTEFPMDLAYATTYLVVVKYDISAAGNAVATLWVNPAELGGEEPENGVSNSSGTTKPATVAIISLRNSANSPKAYIDEIRLGTSWAAVTPSAVPTSMAGAADRTAFEVYPNPVQDQELKIALPDRAAAQTAITLSAWSVAGKLLFKASGSQEQVQKLLNQRLGSFPKGTFVVKVVAGNDRFSVNLVKQ